MNRWTRIILLFLLIPISLLGFVFYAYLSVERQPRINLAPVELSVTTDKQKVRCPVRRWDGLHDNPACYALQENLAIASWEGNTLEVLRSLRMGANVEGAAYQYDTAINFATMKGQVEVVKMLIENGADVNSPSKWDRSPLQVAVMYDQLPIAKLLLENGADVCHEAFFDDLSTPTALDLAVENREMEMIKVLTSYGAPFCLSQYGLQSARR